MVSWSRTATAVVAAHLMCIGLSNLDAAAAQKPWDVFNAFVKKTATSVIEARTNFVSRQAAPPRFLQSLANSIVAAVEGAEDAKVGKKVSEFGFAFFCLVWHADIPSEYEGVLTIGEAIELEETFNRYVRNGAAVTEGCHYQKRVRLLPAKIGDLGWPCPYGNAVYLQAAPPSGPLLNCVIHFHPKGPGHWLVSPDCILDKYTPALASILQANTQPRLKSFTAPGLIDLTRLSADLLVALMNRCGYRKRNDIYGFKAIIVVPAYERPHPGSQQGVFQNARHGDYMGLAANDGHFVIDHLHVPMRPRPQLDLNLPPQPRGPITLHIFAALPKLLTSDGPLPQCGICRMSQGGRCMGSG